MKKILAAMAICLATLSAQAQPQNLDARRETAIRNVKIWTGIGVGVTAGTLAMAHYNKGDREFIYQSGAFLMGWVAAGYYFNFRELYKIRKEKKEVATLQVAPTGPGLALRINF